MECQKEKFTDIPIVDKNIIKDVPWAQEMRNVLEDILNRSFLYWCMMVLNMGENDDVVKTWVNVFTKMYQETCFEMVSDMERVQNNVLLKIEQLLKEFEQLCYTLQISMPVLGDTTQKLSLHQEQYVLKKHIDEYKKLIEERRSELKNLQDKQLKLCNMLGKEPKILKDNPLPSSEKIEEFQRHIEKLETEKFNRLEKFLTVKEELLEIVHELNLKPSSQFEKDVYSSDDSVFLVTDENMQQLDLLNKSLIKQQKSVKEEIAQLRNKIDDYWNLLDVDLKEREDFRRRYTGNSLDVLQALRIEIKRCEDLKKANIKIFIDKLRNELEQLWEKCRCCQTSRMQFGFFHSDCYNEDLLELHEVEIAKWKRYYEENKELLTLLEKHEGLWNKMMELEENATGPNRYNNRGGQLLKEEKERNKLAKQIPQIEDMLFDLAEKYKERHNTSFTRNGISVNDYITDLHEDRENAKKQKLSARKMQREQTLTPAKSALSIFPSTSHLNLRSGTPLSTTKRKLATPMTEESKRLKVLNERKFQKASNTPIPKIKITSTAGRIKRLSVERKKRINKIRRISSQKDKVAVNPNETFLADYGKFQNELSSRDDCRSTIIPSGATPSCTPISSRTLRNRAPTSTLIATPRTPGRKTPTNPRSALRTPDATNKLSAAKPNIKLIF